MKHLVFVDGNGQLFNAIRSALTLGHRVSFVGSREFQEFLQGEGFEELAARLHKLVRIERSTDVDALTASLEEIHQDLPINAVFSLLDLPITAVAAAAKHLGLPFADAGALEKVRDKALMRQCLREAGVPTPRSARVYSLDAALAVAADLGYPVILKPNSGLASIAASSIRSPEHLAWQWAAAMRRLSECPLEVRQHLGAGMLIEERLAGPMFSVELIVRAGTYRAFMVSGRDRNEYDETDVLGIVMPGALSASEWNAAVSHATDVLEALGFEFGCFHVEMIWTMEGPRLIEVNPRLMGGSMPSLYAQLTGRDAFHVLFGLHLGEAIDVVDPQGFGHIVSWRLRTASSWTIDLRPQLECLAAQDPASFTCVIDWPQRYPCTLPPQSLLGRFQIRGGNAAEARQAALAVLVDVERELGVRLVRPSNVFEP